jgi:hypothetical protein
MLQAAAGFDSSSAFDTRHASLVDLALARGAFGVR